MNLGKKDSLEPGYVYAPYIPVQTSQVIYDYVHRRTIRKKKINKIFDLGLDIKDDFFSTNKTIVSRYSKKKISHKYYQTIEMKKPTL